MTAREAYHERRKINIDLAVLKRARQIAGNNSLDDQIRQLTCKANGLTMYLAEEAPETISADISAIAEAVSETTGIPVDEMMGPRRFRKIVDARHAAFYVAWSVGHTTTDIGRYFGRDHSTVVVARDKVMSMLDFDARMEKVVKESIEMLEAA